MAPNTTKRKEKSSQRRTLGVPILDLRLPRGRRPVVLGSEPVVVGRGPGVDVVIEDDGVSRQHAKFVTAADAVVHVFDLESTNGTFVNEERISFVRLRPRDEITLGPDIKAVLRYSEHRTDPLGVISGLTPRQLQLACLAAEGLTSAEIAERLELSSRTVDSHLLRIFRRLDIRGRVELTRCLTDAGFV